MEQPVTIQRVLTVLFIVQFFTWLGLFSLWIYATPVFTRYIFHTTNTESEAYNAGIYWVSICFALYSVFAAVLAFALPKLSKRFGKGRLHGLALIFGAAGLMSISLVNQAPALIISFLFIGIAWSSIANIPYTIISEHAPEKKMAYYFGVFNFSVVIPQATAALLLGYITRVYFKGETINTIFLGGTCMLVAGVIMLITSTSVFGKS